MLGFLPGISPPELRPLCDNVQYQIVHSSYEPDELAARFHHQLVKIHPFPNGNGHISRIKADLVLVSPEPIAL